MQALPLPSLNLGESAKIVAIHSSELQLALMKLGVMKGDQFRLSNIAPLGDPIAIEINRTKISIRKRDAGNIMVSRGGE